MGTSMRPRGGVALLALGLALSGCATGGDASNTEEPGSQSADPVESAGFATCDEQPNTCNSGDVKEGGSYTHTIEKDILNWNLSSVDGHIFDYAQVLNGIYQYAFIGLPDLSVTLNTELLESAERTNDSPQTIVYTVRDDAVWNDGEAVDFDDFEYAWKTQDPDQCKACEAATSSGYDQIKSMEGSDDGKTVTVVFEAPFTDWQALFGPLLPAHIAAKQADISTQAGLAETFNTFFSKTVPTWSMGPYILQKYENDVAATLAPNDTYWGEQRGHFDTLVFRVIQDSTQEATALENREVQGIYPQPQIDMVQQVKQIPGVIYRIGNGLPWEHFDINMRNEFFKQGDPAGDALRRAIFVATDRQDLIDKTVGQFAPDVATVDNHTLVPGQEGYADVLPDEQGSGDTAAAKKILSGAGYTGIGSDLKTPDGKDVPTFRFRYTTGNTIRQQEGELLQSYVAPLGIKLKLQPTDDLGGTLGNGDFDIIVFGWAGSPFPFAAAKQVWSSNSSTNFGGFTDARSDRLLAAAASNADPDEAVSQLNQASKIMAEANFVLPLYQKPTLLAVYSNIANIRPNPTTWGPSYNMGAWGERTKL